MIEEPDVAKHCSLGLETSHLLHIESQVRKQCRADLQIGHVKNEFQTFLFNSFFKQWLSSGCIMNLKTWVLYLEFNFAA